MAKRLGRHIKVTHREEFLKTLIPDNYYLEKKIEKACADCSERLLNKIRIKKNNENYKSYFSVATDSTISKLETSQELEDFFSVRFLNTFLCFFFYKKPANYEFFQEHTLEDLKKFFSYLQIDKGNYDDRNFFQLFFKDLELVKDDLDPLYHQVSIQITENFKFLIEEKYKPLENIENYITELDHNSDENKIKSEKNVNRIKDFFKTYNKSILNVLAFFSIGLICFFTYNYFTKKKLPFKEIKIGEQIWSSEINIPIEGSTCYEDNEKNCIGFGRLYSYDAAKKVADMFDGWEIPLMSDYNILISNFKNEQEASNELYKDGKSGFNAILSGYKQGEDLKYVALGEEAAFWTSSIGGTNDDIGQERPFALRIISSSAYGNLCDCWTRRDYLSLRLIKTDRGYVFNKVNDNVLHEKVIFEINEAPETIPYFDE